jgi:MYXO-CTERM domain-containing protein
MKNLPCRLLLLTPLLALGRGAQAHAASLFANVAVTDQSGSYRYEFTFSNTGATDIPMVEIGGVPLNDLRIASSLTTPPEFLGTYDSGAGKIGFAQGASSFTAGNAFNGFRFESAAPPGTAFTSISAFDVNGDTVAVTVIPEAAAAGLAIAGLAALAAKRRR